MRAFLFYLPVYLLVIAPLATLAFTVGSPPPSAPPPGSSLCGQQPLNGAEVSKTCSPVARRRLSATQLSGAAQEPSSASAWRGAKTISALTESTASPVFDVEKIKEILPHRFPFLLVDKVLEFEPGKRAVGVKQVTANEDQFNGHFPSRAILPGVLQVEALAQLAGIVALQPPISDGKGTFFFAGVDGVKWKKPVVPGDTLVMEVELTTWKEKFGIAKATGKAYVDGKIAVEVAEMTFALAR
ncbi:beta-hydroxyacyl-acyl carrier protein dehydratase [Cystoisospora suis]|uniref:3-hydroxyacyl-[acyl-carrier-protein] dehydratase n=1 Tax=Cystoisospora suis TaxID=483139 RepID=A0A2C6LCS2_9APIC|nr:beta-hydroxyacyl-acyl carrier protein dehydratase [Cystoisospora suis]